MIHACPPLSSHAVGLIGRGISASRSPAIHEAEARALGKPLTYRLFDFDMMGWGDEDLGRAVRLMRDVGYSGANVTFPFKQQVIEHCDELGDEARCWADGRWVSIGRWWRSLRCSAARC